MRKIEVHAVLHPHLDLCIYLSTYTTSRYVVTFFHHTLQLNSIFTPTHTLSLSHTHTYSASTQLKAATSASASLRFLLFLSLFSLRQYNSH